VGQQKGPEPAEKRRGPGFLLLWICKTGRSRLLQKTDGLPRPLCAKQQKPQALFEKNGLSAAVAVCFNSRTVETAAR